MNVQLASGTLVVGLYHKGRRKTFDLKFVQCELNAKYR